MDYFIFFEAILIIAGFGIGFYKGYKYKENEIKNDKT